MCWKLSSWVEVGGDWGTGWLISTLRYHHKRRLLGRGILWLGGGCDAHLCLLQSSRGVLGKLWYFKFASISYNRDATLYKWELWMMLVCPRHLGLNFSGIRQSKFTLKWHISYIVKSVLSKTNMGDNLCTRTSTLETCIKSVFKWNANNLHQKWNANNLHQKWNANWSHCGAADSSSTTSFA